MLKDAAEKSTARPERCVFTVQCAVTTCYFTSVIQSPQHPHPAFSTAQQPFNLYKDNTHCQKRALKLKCLQHRSFISTLKCHRNQIPVFVAQCFVNLFVLPVLGHDVLAYAAFGQQVATSSAVISLAYMCCDSVHPWTNLQVPQT